MLLHNGPPCPVAHFVDPMSDRRRTGLTVAPMVLQAEECSTQACDSLI
ncbi:hypothetical protein [Leclercia adecarboxylata]|nr:hypothetical protein [Leclercia adecarboxylata]